MLAILIALLLLVVVLVSPASAQNACRLADGTPVTLAELPTNTWCVADNSVLYDAVGWPDNPNYSSFSSRRVTAESGAAFDHTRSRLIIFGGGHAAYYGNEVYVYDVAALAWARLTDPSVPTPEYCAALDQQTCSFYDDGLPRSRHTLGQLVYVQEFDELCALGVYGTWRKASAGSYNTVSCFSFTTLTWRRRNDANLVTNTADKLGISTRDPMTGLIYARSTNRTMRVLDPVTDAWSIFTTSDPSVKTTYHTMDAQPGVALFSVGQIWTLPGVVTGEPKLWRWDLEAPGPAVDLTPSLSATCMEFVANRAPGFAWHPPSGKFLAWFGRPKHVQAGTDPLGGTVYSFDPVTLACEKITPVVNSAVPAQSNNPSGVYGRWRYDAALDVFVGMHSATLPVSIYRP